MIDATAGTLSRRQARRATTAAAAALGLGALATRKATAQGTQPRAPGTDYPNRPVRVVVAFAPGGNADITARLISAALSAQIGQQFVVENRPSGGGVVASEVVAQSAPDGYTILVGALSTHVLNVGLFKHLPVDPLTGFEHITISSSAPPMLVVRPTLPARSLAEFRDLLKGEPGRYQCGSAGNGSTGH